MITFPTSRLSYIMKHAISIRLPKLKVKKGLWG